MRPAVDLSVSQALNGRALPDALSTMLEARWQTLLDTENIKNLGIAVGGPLGIWESPPDEPFRRFYWASVGKLVTSVLIQQLAQEGLIQLDQPLSSWYPALPGAKDITVRMLLSHRSGFASHNQFEAFQSSDMPGSPEDVADFLRGRPLLFCPGTNWYYSNSAYMLLGRVIEATTGQNFQMAVSTRVAQPLGAFTLEALTQGETPSDVAPLSPSDPNVPRMAPGDPFSAGNIVATPRDMLLLLEGVFNGQLVGGAALEGMTTELYPMFDPGLYYGLGIMIYELPDNTWAGHSGGTPGARAILAYSINDGVYAAVALTGEGSAESIARLFMNLLRDAR